MTSDSGTAGNCPPHRFHVDHGVELDGSFTVEIHGVVFQELVGDVFAYCPECGVYLDGAAITQFLNERYAEDAK